MSLAAKIGVALSPLVLAGAVFVRSPELSPAATEVVLRQLTLSQNATQLDGMHLVADEDWTDGKPGDADDETDTVTYYRGVPIEIATANNGKPLSSRAAATEQKNAARVVAKIDRIWTGEAETGRMLNLDGEVWPLPDFLAQFIWTAETGPSWQGHNTVRLHFVPDKSLPTGSRMQKILRMSTGDLEIDAQTGQLLRGSFHSLGPVHYGGGLLADIGSFEGQFEMQPLGGCWVMKNIEVSVAGRELLHRFHGQETMSYKPAASLR